RRRQVADLRRPVLRSGQSRRRHSLERRHHRGRSAARGSDVPPQGLNAGIIRPSHRAMSLTLSGLDVQAIVFDVDGVIIDSEVTNFAAWVDTYRHYGAELTVAEYVESMGGRHINIYELLTRKAVVSIPDEESVRTVKGARHTELLAPTDVLPGVLDWI